MQPALGSIKKIEHEYSLRDELDSSWAVRPLALSDQPWQMTLVLEDTGGETLARVLPWPIEPHPPPRLAVGNSTPPRRRARKRPLRQRRNTPTLRPKTTPSLS